jgi:hypothetical protein
VGVIRPLLAARKAIEKQVRDLDRRVLKLARRDVQVRKFMTVPGVGPITALCFKATIDDPTRFPRSRSVGAYVGLTTRRHASGEVDWSGRISKCGDAMLRTYLFEAANVLLTRVPKCSALKAWGMRLAKRNGLRKAKVAVARKLAVILHRPRSVHKEDHRVPATPREKTSLPGRQAVVRSLDAWRALERVTALSTLIRQRRLTPSCGGRAPTAERTVGPARNVVDALDRDIFGRVQCAILSRYGAALSKAI